MITFDVAIIGNGIIGTMIAYRLSKIKNSVALIGPKNRRGSASMAAGAMLNVFGEIDYDIENNDLSYLKNQNRRYKLAFFKAHTRILYFAKNIHFHIKIKYNYIYLCRSLTELCKTNETVLVDAPLEMVRILIRRPLGAAINRFCCCDF